MHDYVERVGESINRACGVGNGMSRPIQEHPSRDDFACSSRPLPPKDRPVISEKIELLFASVEAIGKTAADLIERINPILAPEPPAAGDDGRKDPYQCTSPVAELLEGVRLKLEKVNMALHCAKARLEI